MLRMMGWFVVMLAMPGLAMAGKDKKDVKQAVATKKQAAKKYPKPWSPRPDATGLYGTKTNEKYVSTTLAALFKDPGQFKGKLVRVRGRIAGVCQVKGCWMMITDGKHKMRVRFKNYAFFMPTNTKGYMATAYGYARAALIPVRVLRHYAEDRGASAAEIQKITKPKQTVAFMATWVELKKLSYKRK